MPRHVSVIIPARNEARYIGACVRSILAQDVDAELEVIVADGLSADGTGEIARDAGARVVTNPERTTPAALNRALAAASGDVILRFDAHSEMDARYVANCLRALDEEEAANVGGWCEVQGRNRWGDAIATALASRMGVGNPRLWIRPTSDRRVEVETVPFGCFPANVIRNAGGWRNDLLRNQDFELNHRLRAGGGRIVFDPAIRFTYRPRESLRALGRQYWQFGRWKAIVLAGTPESLRPRQLAPLALLVATVSAVRGPGSRLSRMALGGYALAVGVEATRSRNWRTAAVLVTIHVSWGLGFVASTATIASRRMLESTTPRAG
jgi:succinoglycan biosynthesis protein ExoA